MNKHAMSSVVAVLALSLAACGGSDSDSESAADKASASSTPSKDTPSANSSKAPALLKSSGDYCKDMQTLKDEITGDASSASLASSVAAFKILASSAPSKIEGDWKKVEGAFNEVADAFSKAGVELSDTDALQKAITDGDIDVNVVQKLTTDDVLKSMTTIEAHAKSDCKIDLSETPAE